MNQLAIAIQAANLTGTAAAIRADLSDTVELSRDATAYTWSGLAEKLIDAGVDGTTVAGLDQVLVALPGGSMLDRMLSSGGVDFTGPVIRASLTAIAESAPQYAGVVNAMLGIGITHGPQWQKLGLPALPSEDEIKVALEQIANPPSYDRRTVLLSLNMADKAMISLVVREAYEENGQFVTGDVVSSLSTSDAENSSLTNSQRAFTDAVISAVRAYVETL